jgi:translation initiation factor 3 subunit M
LRPTTLLALLSVLALSSDLPALSLSSSSLATSLNQWAIPTSEKIAFLVEAADIYQSASLLSKSLELSLLALNIEVSEQVAQKAVVLTLADESKFDLSQVLKTQGVTAKISGKAAELVRLFTEADELEAVSQGQQWAEANASYISGFSTSLLLSLWPVADNIDIPKFTPESIGRKLRLIALTTLCSRSTSKQISYAEISSALSIPDADVEAWVIDGKSLFPTRITPQADIQLSVRICSKHDSHNPLLSSRSSLFQQPVRGDLETMNGRLWSVDCRNGRNQYRKLGVSLPRQRLWPRRDLSHIRGEMDRGRARDSSRGRKRLLLRM